MTINYGKRDPGGLTAASPGDTLYIPFATYQDSGASIGIGGTLAVSDIEVYKNGNATARATDSGYSLISDTGQYGDSVGLHRFSIQLFNTSDDTGFFDAGSQYHVAVDSITVDGRTVRFFPAVFEIGTPRANVVEINGDTGHAVQIGKFGSVLSDAGQIDTGTGAADTGILSNSVWNSLKASHGDTGSFGEELAGGVNVSKIVGDTGAASRFLKFAGTKITDSGTVDTGTGQLQGAASSLDTGAVNQAVWQADASRTLTTFNHDTGVADTVWKSSTSDFTADTGSVGYAQGRLMAVKGDTGAAHLDAGRLGVSATATVDTGAIHAAVWQVPSGNANRTLTNIDTGAALHLAQLGDEHDTGRLQAEATATLDTGAIANAVWNSLTADHADTGTFGENLGSILTASFDTGAVSNAVWNSLKADHGDTGTFGEELSDVGGGTASVDTGQINRAVWQADASRTLTAWTFDTGVQQKLDRLSNKVDTGVPASVWTSATRTLTAFSFDTGVQQKLDRNDTGLRSAITQLSAKADTGVPASVWASATRTLTGFAFDTGIQQAISRLDTGMSETIDAIQTQTDKLTFDTGGNELHSDIRKVANVQIQGAGDTGTGNTWRPI